MFAYARTHTHTRPCAYRRQHLVNALHAAIELVPLEFLCVHVQRCLQFLHALFPHFEIPKCICGATSCCCSCEVEMHGLRHDAILSNTDPWIELKITSLPTRVSRRRAKIVAPPIYHSTSGESTNNMWCNAQVASPNMHRTNQLCCFLLILREH